ncbi:hypothetical protein G7070_15160 [Propioniciclava coleopterorum]|uniref:Uncharacterized protein n=1 Tax=Propioniciclava coleopterorum TaxID=2714937 RepID=A0A6G7Y9R7_9ACTN|nr:hypothetical protein [Propioniciclava coleopterorum]QIK73357.1 hypothetical protein G7070_15160 [Propioniciclava coleopterorum]
MPDLADRISRAAVAALDLAPFDDRFASLSRQVLTGGASRFGRVVDERQAISYVIPVGVAGERIDYGALVLQPEAAGLLWRDAHGADHHASVSVTPTTPATYSTVSLGGEPWVRFSIGSASRLTFLVPPVKSRALLPTLIDHFGATSGPAPSTVLPEPSPEPARVRFPDAASAPVAPIPVVEPTVPLPGPPADAPAVPLPSAHAAPVRPDAAPPMDATQPMSALDITGPIPTVPAREGHEGDGPDRTEPEGDTAAPGAPRTTDAEATQVIPPREQPSPWAPTPGFELFRDEPRSPAAPEPTRVIPTLPEPTPAPAPDAWQPNPAGGRHVPGAPSARLEPVTPAAAYAPATTSSATLRGFLLGLLITVGVGAAIILFQLIV